MELRQCPARAALNNPTIVAEGVRQSSDIHAQLWQHAEASAREAPNDITATFIGTLNDVIDVHAERVAALRSRIPPTVWLLLGLMAAMGCGASAYAAGAHGVRMILTSVALPLLISVVILLIADLTNERQGIISVSQQPLIDLQTSLRSEPDSGH